MTRQVWRPFIVVGVWLGLALSGCVTESSGGMPGPASKDERVQAQLDLARGYMEKREWARARRPLERALEIDPANVETHVLRAVLFQTENEPDLAEYHYKTALRLDGAHAQALNNYGSYLYTQGRHADAVSIFEQLVQDTDYRARAQAFENLGMSYLRVDRTDDADRAFERALDLNPRLPRSNLEVAQLAFAADDIERAEEHYRLYSRLARPSARSLCLGLNLATVQDDKNGIASARLALKNLFPEQAASCQVRR